MPMELTPQFPLSQRAACKNDQAACLFVQTVYDPQARQFMEFFAESRRDGPLHPILERGSQLTSGLLPVKFGRVSHRVQARRLFHDDDMLVQVADIQGVVERFGQRFGMTPKTNRIAFFDPSSRIEAQFIIKSHMSADDESTRVGPTATWQVPTQDGRQRQPRLFRRDSPLVVMRWYHANRSKALGHAAPSRSSG
jgi:hypothetical protein